MEEYRVKEVNIVDIKTKYCLIGLMVIFKEYY